MQCEFFPAKFYFCILEKGILAGKNLLFKRVNLLCEEGFFSQKSCNFDKKKPNF
jgi:hypothetical protein